MSPNTDQHRAPSCGCRSRASPLLWCGVLTGLAVTGWLAPETSLAVPLASPVNPPPFQTIQGEILKIDGDLYVIKPFATGAGREVRLRVDEKTVRLDTDQFRVGDVIIADITPEGHVVTIMAIPPNP